MASKTAKILMGLLVVLIVGAVGFTVWALNVNSITEITQQALQSDEQVLITDQGEYITFEPVAEPAKTGLIFYPGGRVDYRAYAPVLRLIAQQGYFVALLNVNLNLALFDVDAAEPVLKAYPQMEHWAVGGHSLGGVAAATFAASHPQISGVVFWAAYPADGALKNTDLKVISIYGLRDGLASPDKIERSKVLLPESTVFIPIEGGNHSQFGDYGFQEGDNAAGITPEFQWQRIAEATISLLASLGQ